MNHLHRLLSVSLLALAACAGAEADPKTAASPASTAPAPTAVEQCEAFFAKAATCSQEYIPALVDLRIELDKPAGIAEYARTDGRDAVIAHAREEWAQDSQPAAIHANCEQVTQKVPADQLETLAAAAQQCMAMADCGAYSQCAVQVMRGTM